MVGGRLLPPVDRCPKWLGAGSSSLNSNAETLMTAICDARLIYRRGGFHEYLYALQVTISDVLKNIY